MSSLGALIYLLPVCTCITSKSSEARLQYASFQPSSSLKALARHAEKHGTMKLKIDLPLSACVLYRMLSLSVPITQLPKTFLLID